MLEILPKLLLLAGFSSIIVHAISTWALKEIMGKRDAELKRGGVVKMTFDVGIIFLSSFAMALCFYDSGTAYMALGAVFGAFFAGAAWSDAKTGWVPDTLIIPAFAFGMATAWAFKHAPVLLQSDYLLFLGVFLGAIMLFLLAIFAYMYIPFVRITPPDFAFVLLMIAMPKNIFSMSLTLGVLIVSILMVRKWPNVIRGLIPENERNALTAIVEESLGYEDGYMIEKGWFPLGPISLISIIVSAVANMF